MNYDFKKQEGDMINYLYPFTFMDDFHDYKEDNSVWRYQHRQRASFIKNKIEQYSSGEKVLLDAGCGKGPYTYLSIGRYGKIYSFDYFKTEVERAKNNINKKTNSKNENILFDCVDLSSIPLEDKIIDVVIFSETLEHIPDYKKGISEIHRILKNDGIVIFSAPNAFSFFWQQERLFSNKLIRSIFKKKEIKNFWEISRHWHFPFWKMESLLKKQGFKIIEKKGCFILPIPSKFVSILIKKFPRLFLIYDKMDRYLSKKIPQASAFYMLILKK